MRTIGFILILFVPLAVFGDTSIACSLSNFTDTTLSIDASKGIITDYPAAKRLVVSQLQNVPTYNPKTSSAIIHIVLLDGALKSGDTSYAVTVKASHWYAFDPAEDWTQSATRLYGTREPFLLLIFLNGPENSFVPSYTYTSTGRNPAPLQDLADAAKVFESTVGLPAKGTKSLLKTTGGTPAQFCWAQLSVSAPGAIDITPKVTATSSNNTVVSIDPRPTEFDDEGFYHWDVSVGVPILSYKQLQSVTAAGADLTTNVDKRNMFVIGDWYLKAVDVKNNNLFKVPYLIAGASVASKPLHGLLAGVGWEPAIANFYGGFLIITNNLPNHKTERVIKGAFGINLPVRAILGKFGVDTQTTAGK